MITAGIVAEYNPFHNGHRYQIEQTRKKGATHIVAVMSGSAVQRGDVAVYPKHERAEAAVKNGADLVIELPCPYSCSNSEVFAKAAVYILAGLGENVVNMISFGSENDSLTLLEKAADISEELSVSSDVKRLVSQGLSYPKALYEAAGNWGEEVKQVFASPNNVLAIEYIKAARKNAPWLSICPIERKGSGHDSNIASENIASASMIRDMIGSGRIPEEYVPYSYKSAPSFFSNMDKAALFKILTAEKYELLSLPDVSESIANRFISVRRDFSGTVEDFALKLKSRNVTLARVRRLIIHLVLGIKASDAAMKIPYGRILAFNERGREILAAAENRTLLYDTSLKRLEENSSESLRISVLERKAAILRDMCVEGAMSITNEYRQKIQIIK